MKWSVGDKVLYEYRPEDKYGDTARDYHGEIIGIGPDEHDDIRITIKFKTIADLCEYRPNDYVIERLKLVSSKFKDNNPNLTFREKHVAQ
jgi:hypothetical protein